MDSLFRKAAVERSGVRIGVCMAHTGVSFGAPSGMGPSTVAVDFDGRSGPRLLLGAHVELDVSGAGAPLHVHARVASRAVSRDRLRYDFSFNDENLSHVLRGLAQRAAAEVVPLGSGLPAEVVAEEDLRFAAHVVELSAAWATLHVRSPHDRWVAPGEHVQLLLTLGDTPCALPCRVMTSDVVSDGAAVSVAVCEDEASRGALERVADFLRTVARDCGGALAG